jgi:phenylacetate-CoA ligase
MRRVYASYLAELGIGAQDLVALTLPVGMAGGGVKLMQACEALGAAVLRVGSLPTRKKVEAMRHYRTSALIATPAYVDRLGQAAEESGILPRDLGVRRILVATQSVTTDWIESTQEAWGASLFEWYGTSSGLAAFSCRAGMLASSGRRGTLHWNPVFAFQEVVDRKGGGWIEGGQRGELIGTPLQVEAEALLRIQSGDEVEFRPPGSCACGSEWPGIESGTVRRLDDMLKVKGVNLVPASVEAVLFGLDGVRDYRARVFQDRARREVVRVEVLAPAAAPGLALRLQERLTEATGLSFDVALLDDDARWTADTPGEVVKVRRWIDERVGQ